MKNLITILILFVAFGCDGTMEEVQAANEEMRQRGQRKAENMRLEHKIVKLVGSYEVKDDGDTFKFVFLENGKVESYKDGEKYDKDATWKIVGKDTNCGDTSSNSCIIW